MIGRADDAFLLHALDQRGSTVITDPETALDIRGRCLAVPQHDGNGLVVRIIGFAQIARANRPAAVLPVFIVIDVELAVLAAVPDGGAAIRVALDVEHRAFLRIDVPRELHVRRARPLARRSVVHVVQHFDRVAARAEHVSLGDRDAEAVEVFEQRHDARGGELRHQLDALLKVDNLQLDLGTVYSSVHYPQDCAKACDALDLALAAIEHADRAGDYLPYEPLYLEQNLEHIHLLSELNIALQDDLLELYVQPILDVKQQKIHAAELLIRWYHPKMGQISPVDFIPLAEQTGMISQVTEWVLDKTLILQKQLADTGANLRLSMNISPLDLRNAALISRVIEAVKSTSYSTVPLQLELTETAFVDLVKDSEQALKLLERSNIRISLDDFGVGQSSLARLQGLPLGELKIDRDLLCQAVRLNDDTVLRYAVMLGKSLQLYTVVEGVETLKELEFARRLGADAVQGYLLAKPMPFATFSTWLLDFEQQGFRLS